MAMMGHTVSTQLRTSIKRRLGQNGCAFMEYIQQWFHGSNMAIISMFTIVYHKFHTHLSQQHFNKFHTDLSQQHCHTFYTDLSQKRYHSSMSEQNPMDSGGHMHAKL